MRMPRMAFPPSVTVADPGSELRWAGTLGRKQVFYGQHSFVLSSNADGTTRLTNREDFSDLLVTLARPLLKVSRTEGYVALNVRLEAAGGGSLTA